MTTQPHGTRARYLRGPCRCNECKAANSEYTKMIRALHRRRNPPVNAKHGTIHCACYYGCKCVACRAAVMLRKREDRRKARLKREQS